MKIILCYRYRPTACDDLNLPIFEGLVSGSMVLTNRIPNGQSALFQYGVHLVEYVNED